MRVSAFAIVFSGKRQVAASVSASVASNLVRLLWRAPLCTLPYSARFPTLHASLLSHVFVRSCALARWATLLTPLTEIMDILRVKKGMAPTPPSSRRRAKKRTSTGDAQEGSSRVVSKEFIEDSDDESGEE